jgi:hypothetical protein
MEAAPVESGRSLCLEGGAAHLADSAWLMRSMAENDSDRRINSSLLSRSRSGASLGLPQQRDCVR